MSRRRPPDIPDAIDYLNAVKAQYTDDPVTYVRFLRLVLDWYTGDSNSIDVNDLIEKISALLRRRPGLLQDFNALLPSNDYRIECLTDVQEVNFITVITPTGAYIKNISGSVPPIPFLTNTHELRDVLSTEDDFMKDMVTLELGWTSCLLQLLQSELDDERVGERYRRKCLKCLRQLVQNSGALPPSFFLRNVVCEGTIPVWGGASADIWKGRVNNCAVCFKVLRVFTTHQARESLLQAFCHEALVWRQLHHPNVLAFYGVNKDLFAPSLCLISPWMDHGHIMNYLEANPDHDRLISITEVAEGLRYLHELNPTIIHGDVKGANILVTHDLRCCLSDFGLASIIESQIVNTATSAVAQGTVRWMAPELMHPASFPGCDFPTKPATDVYAFGATAFEIITGKPPFSHYKNDAAVIYDVLHGIRPHRPPPQVYCPDRVWSMIESCLAHQPPDRPTVQDLTQIMREILGTADRHSHRSTEVTTPTLSCAQIPDLTANEPKGTPITSWLCQELLDCARESLEMKPDSTPPSPSSSFSPIPAHPASATAFENRSRLEPGATQLKRTESNVSCATSELAPTISNLSSVQHFATSVALRHNNPESHHSSHESLRSIWKRRLPQNAPIRLKTLQSATSRNEAHIQSDVSTPATRTMSVLSGENVSQGHEKNHSSPSNHVFSVSQSACDAAPFTFGPSLLADLVEQKNLSRLEQMGGVEGLIKGLGTNSRTGLSTRTNRRRLGFLRRVGRAG